MPLKALPILRSFFIAGFLLSSWLAACQNQPPTVSTSPPTDTPTTSTLVSTPLFTATVPARPRTAVPSCTVASYVPTPDPSSLFPAVTAKDWVRGPITATVTIIEYADFQEVYGAALEPVLAELLKDFPNDLQLVYRHLPLIGDPSQQPYPFHDKAALATQAAEAAGRQGKFWEMHDILFNRQSEWRNESVDQFSDWVLAQASRLGLDVEKFKADLYSDELKALAQQAWDTGYRLMKGIPSVPFIILNGEIWGGAPKTYDNFATIIRLYALGARQYATCPPMTINPFTKYVATLHTTKGDLVIQLFPDKAPMAVNNFIFLARNGWFDGVMFHTVVPGLLAQTGDPSATGYGGPGYAFSNEVSDLKFDREGVVAMANSGLDSNGSQFFITYAPVPDMDGMYTIFGQLISGMDVLKQLTPRNPTQGGPLSQGDVILGVEILEK